MMVTGSLDVVRIHRLLGWCRGFVYRTWALLRARCLLEGLICACHHFLNMKLNNYVSNLYF